MSVSQNGTPSPIDLSPILAARSLTTYSAAKIIQEATGEQWGTVYQRLKRWGKGEPPCVAIVLRDLAVLGYGIKLVKLKKEKNHAKTSTYTQFVP
jgi:hypothetical protein